MILKVPLKSLIFLVIFLQILSLFNTEGHKSHRRRYRHRHKPSRHALRKFKHNMRKSVEIPDSVEPPEDSKMGGCYSQITPRAERIPPNICTVSKEIQSSPSPMNITAKWIPRRLRSDEYVEVCTVSNNDQEMRTYTLTAKELFDGKEINPRQGEWRHVMGSPLCCFADGRTVQEMKAELNNLAVQNYYEKAVVFESSDLEHCGKWYPPFERNALTAPYRRTYRFIAVVCNKDKQCWKSEAESSKS